MRHILTIAAFLTVTLNVFGQNLEKGIYMGKGLPFTICYLTYSDSILKVEYFYEKGGQIFGHSPAKRLEYGMESFSTKPIFISKDDSINVYAKTEYFLIIREGHEKIKVYKSKDTNDDIQTLRNRHKLFSVAQNLYRVNKDRANFDSQKFWDEFNSYNLDEQTKLTENQFDEKLKEAEIKIKNWLQKSL